MTRKKWNRLRRTRPELFSKLPPWEKMNDCERKLMKRVSVTQAVTRMHSLFISDYAEFEYYPPHAYVWHAFNPGANHQDIACRPLQIPGLGGKLWTVEPGYPPQSWPGVEVTQDRFLVDGKFHVEQSPPLPPQTPDKESCPEAAQPK